MPREPGAVALASRATTLTSFNPLISSLPFLIETRSISPAKVPSCAARDA